MITQLDFFDNDDDLSLLRKQDEFLLDRVDNLRRGLFKRHDLHQKALNELLVMITKQEKQIEDLKNEIEKLRDFLKK